MKRNAIVILALLVLVPGIALAQAQTTGGIQGQVVDEAGNPIAGAEVSVSGPTITDRITVTSATGTFTSRLLPPGTYTVVVSAPGYQAAVLSLRVLVGETHPLDVVLLPGEDFADEIVVHGRLSPMETQETRATFDYTTDVEELPIQNRNINAIAYGAPNTSFGFNVNQVVIGGAPGFDTVVLLDGAEISDPYFGSGTTVYLEDSIQEVQVLTTGISARYGRFQGGVINAVTKSGGNEFSGILRTELSQESWNSQTPFGEDQADDLNRVYQATLGGFILRDRLWFFGGYRTIPDTTDTITTFFGENRERVQEEDRFQVKLRGAITPNHTLDFSYLEFDSSISNHPGLPAGDLHALTSRTDPRDMSSLIYQGVLGHNTFLDGIATEKNVQIASGGDPTTGRDPFLDAWNFFVYNNHWWDGADPSVRDNRTAALNLSHALETGGFGNHLLQGGIQWVESTTAGDNKQTPTQHNLLGNAAGFVSPSLGPDGQPRFNIRPGVETRWVALDLQAVNTLENVGLYVQDSITWNNFRFDLGARYDRYRGTTTGVDAFDMSFDDLSPRLGVTYNITPSWQVLGSWGRYVGRFNDSWGESASGVSSAPRFVDVYIGPELSNLTYEEAQAALRNDAFWQNITVVGSPSFPTVYLADDVRSPYTEEFNLSLRTALPRNSGFASVTYTHREYKELITNFVGLVCDDFGLDFDRPCPGGQVSATPTGVTDTTVWGNDPRATRDYNALAFQVDYRPTARFTTGGSWTWSETRGNYEGEATNQPASGAILGTRERGFPFEAAVPYGYLNSHIRHRANAHATYRFLFDRLGSLSTSGILNYRTGRVWNRTAAVPYSNVPEYAAQGTTYTHFFDGRGNNEFNSVWSLDVAARYGIPVFRKVGLFAKLDVANVLNNDTVISHLTTGTSQVVGEGHREWMPVGPCGPGDEPAPAPTCAGFGQITGPINYQTPRTFLVTLGLQF